MTPEIIYLFDPLCGWCYGASPALRHLAEITGTQPTLLPTGLFTTPRPLESAMVDYIKQADQQITRMSGQAFSEAYLALLDTPGQIINSRPATLAFGLLQRRFPLDGVAILGAIQQARYVGGQDISSQDVLAQLATQFGLPTTDFLTALSNPEEIAATEASMIEGQAWLDQSGRSGVPTVILRTTQRASVLPNGLLYGKPQALAESVKQFTQS